MEIKTQWHELTIMFDFQIFTVSAFEAYALNVLLSYVEVHLAITFWVCFVNTSVTVAAGLPAFKSRWY